MGKPIDIGAEADAAGEAAFAELLEISTTKIGSRLPILYDAFDRFTAAALDGVAIACKPGCATCCSQWVPGVRSFEVAEIARHVEERGDRDAIVDGLRARLVRRRSVTDDLAYARLEIPCVFLEDGLCSIRPIRPFTCRSFFSFGPPERCAGDENSSGFMLEPHRAFDDVLDRLAARMGVLTGDLVPSLLVALAGSEPEHGPEFL